MRRRGLLIAVVLLLAAVLTPAAQAAGGFTLGFNPIPTSPFWLQRASADGTDIVRVSGGWAGTAPAVRREGFVASDPGSPGYDWSVPDAEVRALTRQGLQVLLVFTGAPSWAEAPGRPRDVEPTSWRPDAAQFGQFAHAAALRYDGTYPDPLNPGSVLPRVRYWQAWNEPNLDYYLTPQWVPRRGGGFTPVSPGIYRQLQNAFYAGVKGVRDSNFVVTAGISPYGNPPGITFPGLGHRMPPVAFDRALFSQPVHLQALAQSIYPIRGPLWHAYADDVATPDVYKLGRVLRVAARDGHVLPRGHKPLWVTELGWNSDPPRRDGVPINLQARWYEQAMYTLWRQGVDTVLLLHLDDTTPSPGGDFFGAAGVYYLNGRPKPAATAFRFPFVTGHLSRNEVQAWGRAPVGGRVSIERLIGRRWTVIARTSARPRQVFTENLLLPGRAVLRARVGGQTSLPWTQLH